MHFFIIRNQLPSLSKLGTSLPFVLLFCLMPQLLCMLTIDSGFMIAKNCLLHYLCMIFLLKLIFCCTLFGFPLLMFGSFHKSGKPMCLLVPDVSICITFLFKICLAVYTLRFLFYNTELRPHSNVC